MIAVDIDSLRLYRRTSSTLLPIDAAEIAAGEKIRDFMLKHFEHAIVSLDTLNKVAAVIEPRGFTADNTLYAQSVCPDEINHEISNITELLTEYLGNVFHLSGLAGIPFTGKTGFGAFSHHVPEEGHLFVMMAPHVGITPDLKVGSYDRIGQDGKTGSACGAAAGAYDFGCKRGNQPIPNVADSPDDFQMCYIINKINDVFEEKISVYPTENERQVALVKEMYKIGKIMLDNILTTKGWGGSMSKLSILTGIQINVANPHSDYFLPLSFEIKSKDGTTEDVFEEAFGHRADNN